jgi:hypothetical protein
VNTARADVEEMTTMRAVVLYESLFGNTGAIARSVAQGLREARPDAVVDCRGVDDVVALPDDVDLLVLGAPTHFWGLTSALSRRMELQYERRIMRSGEPERPIRAAAVTRGMCSRLAALPAGRGRPAAAFDTCTTGPLTGGARKAIGRRLQRAGYRLIAQPQTFLVEGVAGPLADGETDQARAWGLTLARAFDQRSSDSPTSSASWSLSCGWLVAASTAWLPRRAERPRIWSSHVTADQRKTDDRR